MKNILSIYYVKIAAISSVIIGVLGGLNFVIETKGTLSVHYYITIPLIILIILIDWAMLFGIDYLINIQYSNAFSKKTLIPIYYLFGILFMYGIIHWANQISISLGLEVHLRQNYFYRRIFSGFILCSVVLLIKYTYTLLEERQSILLENERLLRESLQARFETLRQQVNPHFLFNSLSTLKTMMRNDIDKAEEYIMRLSEVFRYSLQTTTLEKVSLREELTILDAYLFMLKSRFGQNLTIEMQVARPHLDLLIPPFSLQIIVENCVKHNIVSSEKPLTIKIFSNNTNQLTISNTLQPKNSVEASSRVGLANIDKRYQHLSGQHIEIIENSTTFDVVIPLIPNK